MDLEEYRNRRKSENLVEESTKGNAFDNLVFPKDGLDRKKIVRSLVGQHFQAKESAAGHEMQADIVRGKGNIFNTYPFHIIERGETNSYQRQRFNNPSTRSTRGGQNDHGRLVTTSCMKGSQLAPRLIGRKIECIAELFNKPLFQLTCGGYPTLS